MSTELAIRATPTAELEVIADKTAKSGLFGMNKDQIFTLCLLAESEGLHPIAALRRFHVIEGRPAMRADAMQAEFQRSGGRVEWTTSTTELCEATFYHREYAPNGFKVSVSFKELDEAGITSSWKDGRKSIKKNWKSFPRQMLRARAISEGVRAVNPSIVVGIYTPEEVSDFEPRQVTARVVESSPSPGSLAYNAQKAFEARSKVTDAMIDAFEETFPEPAEVSFSDGRKGTTTDQCMDALSEWANEKAIEQTAKYAPKDDPPIDAYLLALSRSANDYWVNWQVTEGINEPKPLLTVFQLENHLAKWLVEQGKVAEGYFSGPDGKQSRGKVLKSLKACYKRDAEKFDALVAEYFGKLMEEKSAELGILSPKDEEGDGTTGYDGPVVAAENTAT